MDRSKLEELVDLVMGEDDDCSMDDSPESLPPFRDPETQLAELSGEYTQEEFALIEGITRTLKNLTRILENFDLKKYMDDEARRGLYDNQDTDFLLSEEEKAMPRDVFRMEFTRKEIKNYWSSLDKTVQEHATDLFSYAGMPIFSEERKDFDPKTLSGINKKNNPSCCKTILEGDKYFYDFAGNNAMVDPTDDCLSIGTCSFYPFIEIDKFNYKSYMLYLKKHILVGKKKGLVFSPLLQKDMDPVDYIPNDWETSLTKEEDFADCNKAYNSIFKNRLTVKPEIFETRLNQASKINRMEPNNFCVLSFGQMQSISGFLMKMKYVKNKTSTTLKLFHHRVIFMPKMCFYAAGNCNRKFNIIF